MPRAHYLRSINASTSDKNYDDQQCRLAIIQAFSDPKIIDKIKEFAGEDDYIDDDEEKVLYDELYPKAIEKVAGQDVCHPDIVFDLNWTKSADGQYFSPDVKVRRVKEPAPTPVI